MSRHQINLTVTIIFIAIIGPLVWANFSGEDADFVIGVTAFSVGVVTFFGVIGLNRSSDDRKVLRGDNLRTAIACSLVITYLFIVCFTTFVKSADTAGKVTQEFVTSFSNVIGITIAFYFGASAATQIFGKETRDDSESKSGDKNG